MHRIGIMQGRLSPMKNGIIQTFPADTWKEEFPLANEIGYELIEWVLDLTDIDRNPLLTKEGRREINEYKQKYNIAVPSVCCDYFIAFPFHSESLEIRMQAQGMLWELVRICPEVGIQFLEIPLIGKSSIKDPAAAETVIRLFKDIEPLLEEKDLYLLLETDILPEDLTELLKGISTKRIQLNYDTGNSAYWGFDTKYELSHYGDRIGNIHIKDCTPKDYSVMLGTGNVDFDLTFSMLKDLQYSGDFILQATRGADDVALARTFFDFTKNYIQKYLK
ncbi:MAG: sugar phosphate isomerase/epimerase [Chitinophagaceae bacterium]|nr:MAG: sugar phosphate isomerase/epimerase [Chitinophagaceae bacterium]